MYTIGQLVKRFGISRSTLLYYDSIGLLSPSARTEANYRLYSETDLARLEKIAMYRTAGLPLESIASILDHNNDEIQLILENRLRNINKEIQDLRGQQKVILQIMGSSDLERHSRALSKDAWVAILRSAGLDDAAMHKWHIEFERASPESHQDFLESLGIDPAEIRAIRKWAKNDGDIQHNEHR